MHVAHGVGDSPGRSSPVLLVTYRVKGKTGSYHEWVLFSVPFALAASIFGFDCPNGCRTGPGGLVVLIRNHIRNLPAMSKKEKEKEMAQHQSGEPFSSVSNTPHPQNGQAWMAPMGMLIASWSSSFVCTSFTGMSFPWPVTPIPATYGYSPEDIVVLKDNPDYMQPTYPNVVESYSLCSVA
jgi:hypothetical protein